MMASAGGGQPSVRRSRPATRSVTQRSASTGIIETLDDKRARRGRPVTRSVSQRSATIGAIETLDGKRVRGNGPIALSVSQRSGTIGVREVVGNKRVRRSSPVTTSVPRPSATIGVVDVLDDKSVQRSSPITMENYAGANMVEDYAGVVQDRKGKGIQRHSKKARLGSLTPSIMERSESSSTRLGHPLPMGTLASPPPLLPTALCAICMEDKLLSECCCMEGCTHLFCYDCISQYVAAKVQENVIAIKCPQPDCKDGSLEPEMCRPFLPADVFDQWCTALCEALFMGDMRLYCPFKDCSAMLIDESASSSSGEKVDVITHSECPHCHRLFCAQCKVPWHAGVTCDVFQSLGANEREREDIMLMEMAKKSKWQRCPKCSFFVERTGGCMFMQCRCGFRFCYRCASPMLIDHYCTECRR